MPLDINLSETSGPYVDDFLSPSPQQKYFVPICLGTFMINRPFLYEYIHELMQKNLNMNIIVGDYLERHNLMFFYGMSEEEALRKISQKTRKIYQLINSAIESNKSKGLIELHSSRDYVDIEETRHIEALIRHFKEKDRNFAEDIDKQATHIIDSTLRKSGASQSIHPGEGRYLLDSYLIEEISAYIYLYKNGFSTEIYPGRDLDILRKISRGEYREFPFDYSSRTHISVSLSLDSGKSYARLIQQSKLD